MTHFTVKAKNTAKAVVINITAQHGQTVTGEKTGY